MSEMAIENQKKRSDEELVLLSRKGDKQATDDLLLRYVGAVRGRARGFFLVGGETEDLIQEGMMGLYRAIGDYQTDGGASFKSFAHLCINRRIIDAVKSYERKKNDPLKNYVPLFSGEWEDPTLSPEEEVVGRESRREFMRAMSGALSDFEFRVMIMYMNGTSCSEICETTNKDPKSVDNAIQRGKNKLRNILTKRE